MLRRVLVNHSGPTRFTNFKQPLQPPYSSQIRTYAWSKNSLSPFPSSLNPHLTKPSLQIIQSSSYSSKKNDILNKDKFNKALGNPNVLKVILVVGGSVIGVYIIIQIVKFIFKIFYVALAGGLGFGAYYLYRRSQGTHQTIDATAKRAISLLRQQNLLFKIPMKGLGGIGTLIAASGLTIRNFVNRVLQPEDNSNSTTTTATTYAQNQPQTDFINGDSERTLKDVRDNVIEHLQKDDVISSELGNFCVGRTIHESLGSIPTTDEKEILLSFEVEGIAGKGLVEVSAILKQDGLLEYQLFIVRLPNGRILHISLEATE